MMLQRRHFLAASASLLATPAVAQERPFRIMMLLTRGWEEACDGFRDHFAARRIPVELIVRDIATDMRLVPGLVQEVRQVRPDLVYVWGTGLAVAALGHPPSLLSEFSVPVEDDHIAFLERGIPALNIIDFNDLSVWHRAGDETLRINPNSIEKASRIAIMIALTVARDPQAIR